MDPGWDGAMVKGPALAVGCRRKHILPGWRLRAGLYLRVLIPAGWGRGGLREDGAQPAAFPASLLV